MADSITCLDCHSVVEDSFVYCGKCGVKLERENFNYSLFWKGIWVWKNSGIFGKISLHRNELWTLKTRLKSYGLTRKLCNVDEALVRRIIREELDGPGSMEGYQSVWHTLQLEGICVARHWKEEHSSPGPNFCWHIDIGYDKLKPYGFPIYGGIDGYSRKVLWLKVARTNNNPHMVANFFFECVCEQGGLSIECSKWLWNWECDRCRATFLTAKMHMYMAAFTTTKELRVGGNFFEGIEHPGGWISLKTWCREQS